MSISSAKIQSLIISTLNDGDSKYFKKDEPEIDANTVIFGQDGLFDSFGLVTFIVSLEEKILDELNTAVTLADEKAVSMRNSPFRTVDTLEQYIKGLLEGE